MTDQTITSDRIEKSITLKAPLERVWRALTDHSEFGAWFGVTLDRPFIAGTTTNGRLAAGCSARQTVTMRVLAIEPRHRFAFTWQPGGSEPAADDPHTLVEFRLHEGAGGTRLEVVESGFEALPAERRAEAFRMNDHGWSVQVERIRNHVDG